MIINNKLTCIPHEFEGNLNKQKGRELILEEFFDWIGMLRQGFGAIRA